MLGLMPSCTLLVWHSRCHMQALQWDMKSPWAQYQGNLSDLVQILEETAKELRFVVDETTLGQRQAPLPSPPGNDCGDQSSLLGWGSHLRELEIRVLWSPAESLLHINFLELRAISLA